MTYIRTTNSFMFDTANLFSDGLIIFQKFIEHPLWSLGK